MVLEKKRNQFSKRIPSTQATRNPPLRKDTSTERDKRSRRVEASISGKKLNLYLDTLEVPAHLDALSLDGSQTNIGTPPQLTVYKDYLLHSFYQSSLPSNIQ
jgi:hypothetical protein